MGNKPDWVHKVVRVEPEGEEFGLLLRKDNQLEYIPVANHPYQKTEKIYLHEISHLKPFIYKGEHNSIQLFVESKEYLFGFESKLVSEKILLDLRKDIDIRFESKETLKEFT